MKIEIFEVMPRDGLQNEPGFVATKDKVWLINELAKTGLSKIEVTSFVSPHRVPQLKDAEEVMRKIERVTNVCYAALVPNIKGAERALSCRVDEINLVLSVSEAHNLKNVGRNLSQSLTEFRHIMSLTRGEQIKVNGTLGTAFGCPYEGKVDEKQVFTIIEQYLDMGVGGITLADTTGMANPKQVYQLSQEVKTKYPQIPITLHFHNTRGMGLANVLAGIEAGITSYDASLGGIGGCPFAPGASGNICTEDVIHMLQSMGFDVEVDLDKLIRISRELKHILGRELPGQVVKAGKSTDLYPA